MQDPLTKSNNTSAPALPSQQTEVFQHPHGYRTISVLLWLPPADSRQFRLFVLSIRTNGHSRARMLALEYVRAKLGNNSLRAARILSVVEGRAAVAALDLGALATTVEGVSDGKV